jgi:two-component system probable response regulator PhcQ
MQETILNVLIVDDEAMILHVLARAIRAKGYRVVTTTDPTTALGLIEKEKINILISDIDMPKMSGTTLVASVKQRFPEVVRILMTGRGTLDATLKAINEGEVFRFLTKPFEDEELLGILREASSRIKELHRFSAVALIIAKREQICNQLEEHYPGISQINQQDGVYLLPTDHVDSLTAKFNNHRLSNLLKRRL